MFTCVMTRSGPFVGALVLAIAALSCKRSETPEIVGAYRLVSLDEGNGHRADATGSLVLTREGRMSVQVMYRDTQTPTGTYAQGGYEASFGAFTITEPGKSF